MSYKAVLFDLDGTLLDTIDDLADSMNTVLSHFGFPSRSQKEYKHFIRGGMDNLVRRSLPEAVGSDPATVAACLHAMREEYGRRWKLVKSRPYDGIPELLDTLVNRRIEMAVLSNKPDDFTKIMVGELLPQWDFAMVLGERASTPKKPHPGAAVEIAQRLRIPPAEFLYLGDTNIDMITATWPRAPPRSRRPLST